MPKEPAHQRKTARAGSYARLRGSSAERDVLTLCIAAGAILLFVGNGSSVLTQLIQQANGVGFGPDRLLTNALLLNVALLIFGWRRYDQLSLEVRQRRRDEARARLMAETDALTGCLNRHSVAAATDALIMAAARRHEIAAFIMIDLDHFKQINDVHGHQAGDQLLKQCAARIRSLLPAQALLARLGGDEFACVVGFDPADPAPIDHLATAIARTLDRPFDIGDITGKITASIGITRSDRGGRHGATNADALLHMADVAMYQAKKQGRGQHMWFEDTMESELRYRTELEAGIREGLERGEFVPWYEPLIELGNGELVGFEMLARWQSPRFGMVGPDVFIPIAEEIGVIVQMGEILLKQALADAREWPAQLGLSINISPMQMRDPWFAQKILKALVAASFPPSRLEVEIPETCLHENVAGVHTLITSLKNQGVSISLDDFGTGFSSLAQLRQLPFDRLKIDRSFISSLPDSADSRTIVETVCVLSKGMNLPVTAEGVETRDVLDLLMTMGQFRGQGHVLGLPQDAGGTLRLIAQHGLVPLRAVPPPADAAAGTPGDPADKRRLA
ncbi:MAG: EAL domain-containing protein [Sphingomonadales bacterium]|nr:EAL domain-containing protein [Sphingomonadales bacterium]MDE2169087.1 EAL domain-containing protein [Sphingomonadales bacterium]